MSKHNRVRKRQRTPVIKVTEAVTHHFFNVFPDTGVFLRDHKNRVQVFLDREMAVRELENRYDEKRVVATVGMGDEKWAVFKKEIPYVVINNQGQEIETK